MLTYVTSSKPSSVQDHVDDHYYVRSDLQVNMCKFCVASDSLCYCTLNAVVCLPAKKDAVLFDHPSKYISNGSNGTWLLSLSLLPFCAADRDDDDGECPTFSKTANYFFNWIVNFVCVAAFVVIFCMYWAFLIVTSFKIVKICGWFTNNRLVQVVQIVSRSA